MKLIDVVRENKLSVTLMAVTATLITVCMVIFRPDPILATPYYISLIVGMLQASANRYAPLVGGFNSILYAVVGYYLGLHGNALQALLVSFPIQIVTFVRWQRNKYGHSTVFRKMSPWGRVLTAVVFAASVLGLRAVLEMLGGQQQLLDSITSLFGVLTSVLTMLSYVEYSYLTPISAIGNIILYSVMAFKSDGGQVAHILVFNFYSFICVTRGCFRVSKLYKEQQGKTVEATN